LERDKKYSEESFWLKTINLRDMFQEDKFTNLYDVKTQVDKIYSLALENSMDQLIIKEWQQHVLTLTSLVDSLRNKSHVTALKNLKKVFGGSRGLNEDSKKLVEEILRSSQREEPVIQRVVNTPMYGGPRSNYSPWGQQQYFTEQSPRYTHGVCNHCQLPGHYARDCPAQRFGPQNFGFDPFRPPQGGRGRGRSFGDFARGAPFPPRRGRGRGRRY